jgi:ubiquinone/menaquinone biosynthesis C-methylase UbiE
VPSELARFYSEGAEGYLELWAPQLLKLSRSLLDRLPIEEATRVLDVGAGVGALLEEMESRTPRGVVVGVDLAEGMIARARPGLATAVMDARALGFCSSAFDVAVAAFMLFHVEDPVEVLREAARVVRPGGTVGTITWGHDPSYLALDIWSDELDAHGAPPAQPAFSRHELVDTEVKVTALLETAGLEPQTTWMGAYEDRMTPDEFIAHRVGHGMSRRRFETLETSVRSACLEQVRSRLEGISPRGLIDRAEVIYAIARHP